MANIQIKCVICDEVSNHKPLPEHDDDWLLCPHCDKQLAWATETAMCRD